MQANVGSERFGDIDTDVMTDLRQMLQLNKSFARSFVSIDEQLQSGLLPQSVSLQLLACMSLACSLSTATVFCEVTWQGQAVTARRAVTACYTDAVARLMSISSDFLLSILQGLLSSSQAWFVHHYRIPAKIGLVVVPLANMQESGLAYTKWAQ